MRVKVRGTLQVVHEGRRYTVADGPFDVPDAVGRRWLRFGWVDKAKPAPEPAPEPEPEPVEPEAEVKAVAQTDTRDKSVRPADVRDKSVDLLTCAECGYQAKSKAGLGAHRRSH